ncbi:MAG: PAS domain-containing protein [Proteobacteria bacterium]|nr:PAS domain-containing protein [Pseudomonadota bacterium]MBU1742778.1 PAS domain-containing protein [Pseudomonadota bacterium]
MDDQAETKVVPYPDILGKMPTGYAFHRIVLDENGRPVDFVFLDVNEAFEELTGFRRQDVIGQSARDILPGQAESGQEWIEACGRVATTGEQTVFEQYSPDLDRWFQVSAYCPGPGTFVTLFHDVSPGRRAAAELEGIEARHYTVLEACPVPVLISDQDRRIRYVNPAFSRLFGWAMDEVLDQDVPMTSPDANEVMDRALAGESCAGRQTTAQAKGGRAVDVSLTAAPFWDEDGAPAGIVVFLHEIAPPSA